MLLYFQTLLTAFKIIPILIAPFERNSCVNIGKAIFNSGVGFECFLTDNLEHCFFGAPVKSIASGAAGL